MRNSGFKGLAWQYIIMDRFFGPTGLESIASQSTPCNSAQKSFQPWTNNINMDVVSFCVIHDSIVNGTPFDHDFKLSTPEIVATESWFFHKSDGTRVYIASNDGVYAYRPNLANIHLREYFAARLLREIKNCTEVIDPNHSKTAMDGIYLDNLELSWFDLQKRGIVPVEYPSDGSFSDMVFNFVAYISGRLKTNGNNIP